MPAPSLNISSVAAKSGSHAISKAETTPVDARQVLRDMRAQLVGKDGTVSSGYLSINTRRDGPDWMTNLAQVPPSLHLETRGRHEWGSWHSEKKDAANIVRNLLKEGYGKHLDSDSETALLGELNTYLQTTGQRLGTHSFVKLIDRLEKNIAASEAGPQTEAKVKPAVRLKANFNLRLKTEGCAHQAKSQFVKILDAVRPDTASLFKHILAPGVSKAGNVASRTQVIGDADGSMCRTLLSAMNSGHMELKEPELQLLAEVMDAEAEASQAYDQRNDKPLLAFQKNPEISAKLDEIVANAKFKPGHHKLVFIGDIVHDRFCNNKVAMDQLIRGLHQQGAVFITGNHDVYDEVNPGNNLHLDGEAVLNTYIDEEIARGTKAATDKNYNFTEDDKQLAEEDALARFGNFEGIKLQNGFHAVRQLDKAASDNLLRDCFTNAHFDPGTNNLYTHNGFQHSGVNDVYLTAFGFLRANSAEDLAEKMNACDFNDNNRGFDALAKEGLPDFPSLFFSPNNLRSIGILSEGDIARGITPADAGKKLNDYGISYRGNINKTDFRPADDRMKTDHLGPAGKTREGRTVTVVHGHNAQHGTDGNVENLNARSAQGVTPISKVY